VISRFIPYKKVYTYFSVILHTGNEQDLWKNENKYENSLFHYTNAKGLKGILEPKKLWATATYCLKDQSEIKYCLDIFDMTADDDFLNHWKKII
jgi:hypothetical protein